MRRLLISGVIVAGLAAPTTFLLAPAASANGNGTCVKLSGSVSSGVTISNCPQLTKATKKAYKSLAFHGSLLSFAATGGTFTWSNGGATVTIANVVTTSPSNAQGACPGKAGTQDEFDATADITAVSDASSGNDPATVGTGNFTARICEKINGGKLKLVPGTKVGL